MVEWTNKDRARQIIDFSELVNGNMCPTDIDGLFEYKNKGFLLFEFKYGDKDLPNAQRLALERMANSLSDGHKTAVVLVARHFIKDPHVDVNAALCRVYEVYWGNERRWRRPKQESLTLGKALEQFIKVLEAL